MQYFVNHHRLKRHVPQLVHVIITISKELENKKGCTVPVTMYCNKNYTEFAERICFFSMVDTLLPWSTVDTSGMSLQKSLGSTSN